MKKITEKISEEEVDFPINFKYIKTNDGFQLKTNSGAEFFRDEKQKLDKILFWGIISLFIGFLLSIFFPQSSYSSYDTNDLDLHRLAGIPMLIGYILVMIHFFKNKIKADFTVSQRGIEIKSKKNLMFIDRENISNIYASKMIRNTRNNGNDFSYTYYKIILIAKESIKLPNSDIHKNQFDLLAKDELHSEEVSIFLVQEFINTLNLNLNIIIVGDENYAKIKTNNSQFISQDFSSDFNSNSDFNSDLEEPKNIKFLNLEIIKNIDHELILKKLPKNSATIILLFFVFILSILGIYTLHNQHQESFIAFYIILGIFSISALGGAISFLYSGRGFYISINSYNIEKRTIFPFNIYFLKPYSIKIEKHVKATMYETEVSRYNPENTSFGVTLKSKSNIFPAIILINGISLEEAKYITWKINYLISKK